MLFGQGKTASVKKSGATVSGAGAPVSWIFDVDAQGFESAVLEASFNKPVIVYFSAPWCAPCKQFAPLLESAVQSAGGRVLMAKVNLDTNPELAQALQVRSVPTVFAFFQGRPVGAFQGAQPQSHVQNLISQLLSLGAQSAPDALDIPQALEQARAFLAEGDLATAQALYAEILTHDETHAEAYAGLVRCALAAGAMDQARALLDKVPESLRTSQAIVSARTALDLAELAPAGALSDLAAAVTRAPDDLSLRFDLAMAEFAHERKAEAIDSLIEIIRRDRTWEDEKARKQLLKFFEALGFSDPLSVAGRRKLSAVLFS